LSSPSVDAVDVDAALFGCDERRAKPPTGLRAAGGRAGDAGDAVTPPASAARMEPAGRSAPCGVVWGSGERR
jgi:hypothetical protein